MSVRVKVCLSKIYNDYRQEAYVNVDSNLGLVASFERHIRKLFNIKSNIYLTIDGILLPSQESINVIHSGDFIVVNEINNGTEVWSTEPHIELNDLVENLSNNETSSPKRAKRIRKRKRKQAAGIDVEIQEDSSKVFKLIDKNLTHESKELISESKKLLKKLSLRSDVLATTPTINPSKGVNHIRFDDDNTATDVSSSLVTPNKQLDSLQPRVVRPSIVLTDAGSTFPTDKLAVKSDSPSMNECKQRLISLKSFANDSNFANVAASIDFEEIKRNIDDNKYFIALKEEPKTYDIVGFKMLKMSSNYEPVLSEWIIAMVKDVEEIDITIHILAGKEETSCPNGKLSMEICDEETESSELITLKRSEMLNVKAFLSD